MASEEPNLYHLKGIEWKGKELKIVTQSLNGPCPLLAIANVLLLRGEIKIHPDNEVVSYEHLVHLIGEVFLSNMGKLSSASEETRLNYQQNMSDAILVMPMLQRGLDVNVGFSNVTDFEYTPECVVFDLLNLRLVHGWLADPSQPDVYKVVTHLKYNQLIEKIISSKSLEKGEGKKGEGEGEEEEEAKMTQLMQEGMVAEGFLEANASQLTYQGIVELNAQLKEGEVVVFFRNNHFSTLHKRKDELFLLLTDQGFKGESVVWETLSNVEGDGFFVDSNFRSVSSSLSLGTQNIREPTFSPFVAEMTSGIQSLHLDSDDPDFLLAKHLQEEENRAAASRASQRQNSSSRSSTSSRPIPPPATQQKKDNSCLIS